MKCEICGKPMPNEILLLCSLECIKASEKADEPIIIIKKDD